MNDVVFLILIFKLSFIMEIIDLVLLILSSESELSLTNTFLMKGCVQDFELYSKIVFFNETMHFAYYAQRLF